MKIFQQIAVCATSALLLASFTLVASAQSTGSTTGRKHNIGTIQRSFNNNTNATERRSEFNTSSKYGSATNNNDTKNNY